MTSSSSSSIEGLSFLSILSKESIDALCKEYGNITITVSAKKEDQVTLDIGITVTSYDNLIAGGADNFKAWCNMAKHLDTAEKKRLT